MQISLRVLRTQNNCIFWLFLILFTSCNSIENRRVSVRKEIKSDDIKLLIQPKSILTDERLKLTKDYVLKHYGLDSPYMLPRGVVIHYTAIGDFNRSFDAFKDDSITEKRRYVSRFGSLNVGVQYLIDTSGSVYQMLPDTFIGRHTIGFNSTCIGIENVGLNENELTSSQVKSNCLLLLELKNRYPSIEYVFGHHEYMIDSLPHFTLFHEYDTSYKPTVKYDPGVGFMESLRSCLLSEGVVFLP